MDSETGGEENLKKTVRFLEECYKKKASIEDSPYTMSVASKDKRKLRRQQQEREANTRGMDLVPFYGKTDRQDDLWDCITENIVSIAIGPAGTGKTLVSLWWGMTHLTQNYYEKIYYVRSDVGCAYQRGRGALPGSMEEKMAPLVMPLHDNLAVMMRSKGAAEYLMNKKVIEPILLEDVRGRSFNNAVIIFDEAQNATAEQCKTVLSRVGEDSKVIITGDTRQIDLEAFTRNNGLLDAYHRLAGLDDVGRVQFTHGDIVRNSVIGKILQRYDD
jgi:phosphate starvation-inducible PhoH-like protein